MLDLSLVVKVVKSPILLALESQLASTSLIATTKSVLDEVVKLARVPIAVVLVSIL